MRVDLCLASCSLLDSFSLYGFRRSDAAFILLKQITHWHLSHEHRMLLSTQSCHRQVKCPQYFCRSKTWMSSYADSWHRRRNTKANGWIVDMVENTYMILMSFSCPMWRRCWLSPLVGSARSFCCSWERTHIFAQLAGGLSWLGPIRSRRRGNL